MLRARKEWGKGKRFILKSRVVISIDKVLIAIEVVKEVIKAKKKKIGINKSWDKSRKIQELVVVLEDEDENSDFSEYENVEIE